MAVAWTCGLLLAVAELGWVLMATTAGADTVDSQPWSTGRQGGVMPLNAAPVAGVTESVGPPSPGAASGLRASPVSPVDLLGWANRLSPRVGIPAVALAAYGSAELRVAAEQPGCHLSWAALAGIGSVESDHGRYGGAVLQPDGRSWPRIIGIPLNGQGVARIRDTDGGRLDGDPVYDRAVGPMQFLPSTWRLWGADADGDGRADPFSLPDAALAAGRYLCGGGGDLRSSRAWTAAVMRYNASTAYLAEVTARGDAYAARSLAP